VVASATLAAFIGGGGLGDLILRGHALNKDHILLAGAIPATLLAFYFEDMFGRLESWLTPKGLKIGERGAQGGSDTFLGFLTSVLLMPLVFGALLPWESYSDAQGSTVILTGMHSQYINIGLALLVLGVILVMRPRRGKLGESRITSFVILVLAGITILIAGAGMIITISSVSIEHTLRSGVYLQTVSAIAIAIITIVEVVRELTERSSAEITAGLAVSSGD
jgi:hypothetical protein